MIRDMKCPICRDTPECCDYDPDEPSNEKWVCMSCQYVGVPNEFLDMYYSDEGESYE